MQLLKVVDFSVEDDADGFVFVENWLVTPGQVDDAEPPHAKSDASLHEDAFVIWAPVNDGIAHPVDGSAIHRAVRMSLDDSGNAAHALSFQHFRRSFGTLRRARGRTPALEPIVPILAGIPFFAVTSGQNDVHHFSSRSEMQNL